MKPTAMTHIPSHPCPCQSGRAYAQCCAPYHRGERPAETADALMRSRYSAYVLGLETYLRDTWHASTQPATLSLDDKNVKWIGLDVRRCEAGTMKDTHGSVEFVARYKLNGKAYRLHEVSRFVKEDGRWQYVDGEHLP